MNRDYKENYVWKEDYITTATKPRLKNSQSRNWKHKRIINTYLNKQYQEIKRTNLWKNETSLW